MIRELTTDEIKVIEDYLRLMNFYYPYYFIGEPNKYSEYGYLISGSYYVNLEKSDNRLFLGICKLSEGNNLSELVSLFQKILRQHKKICVWSFKRNSNVIQLINRAVQYLSKKGIKVQICGTDILFYEFEEV